MNAGLVLLAPFAPTMREEHPLMIALEADSWTLMPITATAEPGGRFEYNENVIVSYRLTDHRRYPDGYQISRPKFVEENVFFTLGGR